MLTYKQKEELLPYPTLEIVGGENIGKVFPVQRSTLSIGRTDKNDIVLSHESVSREHAHIEKSDDGTYLIFDNGSKNGLLVNGAKVEATALSDNDSIQIGIFMIRFRVGLVESAPGELEAVDGGMVDYQEPRRIRVKQPNKRPLIYGGVAILLAGVYFLSNSTPEESTNNGSGNKTLGERIKPEESPVFDAKGEKKPMPGLEDPTLKSAEQEIGKLDFKDSSIQEAELYFRKGQREYFNKNWHRAIDSLRTALAINKNHPAAKFYLQSSVHGAEDEARTNMEMAVKYFESLQYQRSIYHFQQVISLMAHRPGDKIIKDCERYIELANKRLQAAEVFP